MTDPAKRRRVREAEGLKPGRTEPGTPPQPVDEA